MNNFYRNLYKINQYKYMEVLFILILPICVWYLYKFELFNNYTGYIDPWVYFGYVHNFEDLINRYGFPYYSVRFGLVFPLIMFNKVFGPADGYYFAVYFYYLLGGIPFYLLFRKYYSVNIAVLAYFILISSVWYAKTLLWTYTDASGVPYILAGICLIFIDSDYRKINYLFIGILFALAVNSNFFTISICGLSIFGYLGFHGKNALRRIHKDFFWAISGFSLIYVLGWLVFVQYFGPVNIYKSTIDIILWGLGGAGDVYRADIKTLLTFNHVYLPFFLAVALFAIYKIVPQNKKPLFNGASAYAISVILFVCYWEFGSHGLVLDLFFYFSYFIPALFICIILIPVTLAARVKSENLLLNITLAVFILIPLLFTYRIIVYSYTSLILFYSSLILVILSLIIGAKYKIFVPIAVVLYACVFHLFWMTSNTVLSPEYRLYGTSELLDYDRNALGISFINTMPKYKEEARPIYFWYNSNDSLANSLQSTYLWGYSRIMASGPDSPGLPDLQGANLDLLQKRSSLVLFDRDNRIVTQGIEELQKYGLKFKIKYTREICSKGLCYTISVLDSEGLESDTEKRWERDEGLAPVDFDLNWYISGTDVKTSMDDGFISVKTLPNPWFYAAVGSINYSAQEPTRAGVIRLLASVSTASIGIGFLGNDESNFIKRIEVLPGNEPQELYFDIDNLYELKKIVISSWDKAESATVKILEFEIRAGKLIN